MKMTAICGKYSGRRPLAPWLPDSKDIKARDGSSESSDRREPPTRRILSPEVRRQALGTNNIDTTLGDIVACLMP